MSEEMAEVMRSEKEVTEAGLGLLISLGEDRPAMLSDILIALDVMLGHIADDIDATQQEEPGGVESNALGTTF